jgi:hypothetical protein
MYIGLDVVMSIDVRCIFHEMRVSIPWETDQGYKVLRQGEYFIKIKNISLAISGAYGLFLFSRCEQLVITQPIWNT